MNDHTTPNTSQEIPYGYCYCGCGQKTNICTHTSTRLGYVKGEPYPFLKSHALRRPVANRFWLKVHKGGASDCWDWHGKTDGRGYGKVYLNGKFERTHRIAYALAYGPIPDGKVVCHSCDRPSCCNPAHLFLGTQADNVQDMFGKERDNHARGASVNTAKLSESSVRAIRALASRHVPYATIAQEFGVTFSSISGIVRRVSWKHVT